jgi:hypothetical protein
MQTITTIGLDIAKSVFQVHGVDAAGVAAADCPMARPYDGPSQDEADRAPDPIECPNCPKFPGRGRNALIVG